MSIKDLLNDICEQPIVLRNHLENIESIIDTTRNLGIRDEFIFTGIATSYYAWHAADLFLRKKGKLKGQLINTPDLLDYDYPLHKDIRPLFVLSRSGESAEIVRLVKTISQERLLIAITENSHSPLAKRANYLYKFTANEKTYPNTISFTLSLAYAFAVAIGLGYKFSLKPKDWVSQTADALETMLAEWEKAEDIAELLSEHSSLLIDAQGHLTGITNQACLDFQEIRLPAIPVTGGIFRHGTIELTARRDVAVLVFVPNDKTARRKLDLIYELYDQKTLVAAVVTGSIHINRPVPVIRVLETTDEIQPFLYALAMQQIYAKTALSRGLDFVQPLLVDKVTRKE